MENGAFPTWMIFWSLDLHSMTFSVVGKPKPKSTMTTSAGHEIAYRCPLIIDEGMAIEPDFQESAAHFVDNVGDISLKKGQKSVSASATSENVNDCFDCNICLDSAHEPVVTLCGHLYCWPCIYKWLNVQSSSPESDEVPKCPVCKAKISSNALVPLYGRGSSPSDSDVKVSQLGTVIPRRPPPSQVQSMLTNSTGSSMHPNQHLHPYPFPSESFHNEHYFLQPNENYAATAFSNLGGTAMTIVGMVGEIIPPRILGNVDLNLVAYHYPNSYLHSGASSPRIRRQEMQVEKSLSRITLFLFCCFILCLLLF
ncbi:Zinc finger, C3HC4 RING-type [Dillenia turbinata]|uniref:E3 ubiquitin-protein ligase RMA n=1 Tax=Dillenia turbinata TaxID=194707 RepID=A0AAN8VHP4_9MAGN